MVSRETGQTKSIMVFLILANEFNQIDYAGEEVD